MPRDFAPPPPSAEDIARICRDVLGCSPISTETLRSGAWSSAIGLETAAGPMVLRFSMTNDDFRSDQLASRFATDELPIPAVSGTGRLEDRYWCLSQRMPGVHLDELDANQLTMVIPSLAAMLRAMRSVTDPHTSGYGGWDANGNGTFSTFADQLLGVEIDHGSGARGGGWSDRMRPHTHAQAVFGGGVSLLHDLVSFIPPDRQLIHQDTINFNVTVVDDRMSGIFDWGCAMWGDALYDLAWFRFWNPWYSQWAELNLPDRLEELVVPHGEHADDRMRCYLLHIGLMHIRYNAYIENWTSMDEVVIATEKLLREPGL